MSRYRWKDTVGMQIDWEWHRDHLSQIMFRSIEWIFISDLHLPLSEGYRSFRPPSRPFPCLVLRSNERSNYGVLYTSKKALLSECHGVPTKQLQKQGNIELVISSGLIPCPLIDNQRKWWRQKSGIGGPSSDGD